MLGFSFTLFAYGRQKTDKPYIIEVNRIADQLSRGVLLSEIQTGPIQAVEWIEMNAAPNSIELFFNGDGVNSGDAFFIKPVYQAQGQEQLGYLRAAYRLTNPNLRVIVVVDLILMAALLAIVSLLLYIKSQIIAPFHTVQSMPVELAKGHLRVGLKETDNRFFGKFVWGLDLLRETLESQRQTNLQLEKDRQTLIASLSHELKTPVSAIKLYAAALYENLYEVEAKRTECARLIAQKADQIETRIADIMTTSISSLIDREVKNGEFYLSDWVDKVIADNQERLNLLKIHWVVGQYRDKLLQGDQDRLSEVFDNIIDNAIKYGDGHTISVSFYEEDHCQLIRIENSGTPISANELPYVFTSFWRGSNAHDKPGNGLGLYICKHLLTKMKGDVFIDIREGTMAVVMVVQS